MFNYQAEDLRRASATHLKMAEMQERAGKPELAHASRQTATRRRHAALALESDPKAGIVDALDFVDYLHDTTNMT